jgi:hypothetical protein
LNRNYVQTLLKGQQESFKLSDVPDRNEVFSRQAQGDIRITIRVSEADVDIRFIDEISLTVDRSCRVFMTSSFRGIPVTPTEGARSGENEISDGSYSFDWTPMREAIRILATTLYVGPFRNVLNVRQQQAYYDINVGTQVVSAWRSLKSGPSAEQRQLALNLEKAISAIFRFDGFALDPSDDGDHLLAIVNGNSQRLEDLGAGLSQFVLVFLAAALKPHALLLVDEPESNLHPSLQMAFLAALGSFSTFGVIFGITSG